MGSRGFFIIEREVQVTRGDGKQTVVGVIDGKGERRKSQPAAIGVANERATRAAASVSPNGQERGIDAGRVVNFAELNLFARDVAADGADAEDGDLRVVGADDGEAKVGDIAVGDEVGAVGEDITGGTGVEANPI
jgi:hypothetical protein